MESDAAASDTYVFAKCALCCERDPDTIEHPLPESLGGRLSWRMLCHICNSRAGSDLVSQLRRDPMVVLAINAAAPLIPDSLRRTITERMRHITGGPDGRPVVIERRQAVDKVKGREADDGSRIVDTLDAPGVISGMLRRAGATEAEIIELLDEFESAKDGERVEGPGLSVIKHPIEQVEADLSGGFADDRAPGIIAYGYMAMRVGDLVCKNTYFDPVRAWLRGSNKPDKVVIERFWSGEYEATHSLAARQENADLVVQVILFGGVVFNVRFRDLVVSGDHAVYIEDLAAGQSLFFRSLDVAAGNNSPKDG